MASDGVWHMPGSVMRTKTFRTYDQDTLLLVPPSIRDWVDPDSLPAFISDLVDDMDLAPFLAAHDEPRGMPPYHPAMMLKVLLYGYATGVRSSRKLEDRLKSDVGFMYLAGGARPGHKAIGEFRRRHLEAFGALFRDILLLCQQAGLVKLGRVALDGTKVKADASKHKAMSDGRMDEREAVLEAEVARILEEAEAVDQAEDERYGDARDKSGDPDAVPEPRAQRNFTEATDTRSLPALVDQGETNTGRRPQKLLTDAGYQSDDNLRYLEEQEGRRLHRGPS
jgi:transposase